ncbi:YkvA family protein [Caminicella sporogenes]|uniref:YkvA family protein n=1 Tax=Caminicella sporogenes TaxID=166485 RepID=UPI0013565ECA|nr:DUF1232 domain-containing protein [Caminicella sporogenes]WIF94775.1 DUF1232 domain-containing protein [Caminicella sporogenes]
MPTIKKKSFSRYTNLDLLKAIFKFFKRIGVLPKFLLDKDVSIFKKIIILLTLLYVISPLDILPDPILGFGIIDDAVLAVYIISMVSDELDKYIESRKKKDIKFNKDKVIETVEYEVKDDDEV